MSHSILFFFLLSLLFISFTSPSSIKTTPKCSVQQTHALLLFKRNLSSINDTQFEHDHDCKYWLGSDYKPIMMNWNTSTGCCDWNGVTCDHSTGDVIGLDLSCGMLQGTIHPNTTLFHLPRLQKLNLAFNNFTDSQLPAEIGKVSNSLTHLNISTCGFTGQVPTDISHLHKLVSLDLSYNGIPYDYLNLEPHVFINLLQNSTVMKQLSLQNVNISSVLPTNLNISSSLKLLNLGSTGLKGNLPHSIFNLQSLEILDLSFNSLTGHIPDNIFNLKYLEGLDLSGNSNLSGPMPKVNASTSIPLRRLHLFNTRLSGEIPTSIGHLKSLESLDLSQTSLSGEIPTSIGHLKSLEYLDLSQTSLSGEIPTSIGHLKSLESLDLSQTSLSGEIPTSIGHLKSLLLLYLSQTSLSGEIPTSIGHLKSLRFLDLSYCGLNGSLPKSLGNLRYLNEVVLSNNMLSGTLPSSLFTLPSLEFIVLYNNKFQGNMPLELFSLQSLTYLSLGKNQLTGQIDVLNNGTSLQTFQRLTNLTSLDLSYNNFRGDWELDALLSSLKNLRTLILSHSGISVTTSNANHSVNLEFRSLSLASCNLKMFPVSIRAMTKLRYLDLSSNDIQGHIPDWIGEIGRMQLSVLNLANNSITGTIPNVYEDWSELEGFTLNGNRLEGKVPTSLYKCQSLKIIDLGNNQLSDTFPDWLGDLPNLQALVLRSNNFHGGIVTSSTFKFPFQSLLVLDLSHKGFVGQLPIKYFQNFNAMKNVVKSKTKPDYVFLGNLYFSITVSVKGGDLYIPQLSVDYTIVDLSNNKFEGEIPNIIGYLKSLIVLNLSHNNLTGRIPHALGKISEIESLDLSWNQLIGEIPQSLADLTFLEFLNLSQNQLMGRIPQGRQFNTFEENSFGENPKLCGLPLPKKCSEHLPKPQLEGEGDGEEENGFTWKVVVMGYGCGALLGIVLGYLMLSTGRPKWFNAIVDVVEHMILKRQNKRR